jgi:hypothetical protein
MSLTDTETDLPLTPERPSQRSLDPTQPTAEEQAARAREVQTRGGQPAPPQQGPSIALPRLAQTNPAQVAAINPSIPQTGIRPEPVDEATRDAKASADYNLNPPSIYRPPSPNRDPTQLGDDDFSIKAARTYPGIPPGPDMPSPQEAYGVARDANSRMATFGSDAVSDAYGRANFLMNPLAAVADAFSQGHFSQNFSAANLRGLQIQRAEWIAQQERAIQIHGEFLRGANTIAKAEAAGLFTKKQAEDAMSDYLVQSGHRKMLPLLDSHGIKGVYKLLQIEDAERRKAEAALVTHQKAFDSEGRDEIRRQFGFGAETDTAGMTGGREDREAPRTSPSLAGDMAVYNDLPAEAQDAARQMFKGRGVPGLARLDKVDPVNAGKIDQMARGLDAEARRAAQYQDPDPNKSIQQKLADKDAVMAARVDRELPSIMRAMTTYQVDPKSEEGKRWVELAQAYDPRYKPSDFANAQRWFNKDSNERKVVDRANQVPQAALNVFKNLNVFDENASVIQNKFQQWTSGMLGNDDRFKIAFDAIFDLEQHVQAVASLTGTPRVTTLMAKIQNLGSTASPMQVRGAIMPDLISAYRLLETFQSDYEQSTNRHELLPGNEPHNMRVFRDIVRMNTKTGEMPSDAQPESMSVSRNPAEAHKGLKDTDRLPPLPMSAIWQLSDKARELASSDDPDLQQQAHEILQRIGPIIGITQHIPGVDPDAPRSRSGQATVR